MSNTLLCMALVALVGLAGCGPAVSLQPAWDVEHEMMDLGFEGIWQAEGDDCVIAVIRQAGHYLVVYMENGETSRYEGHLLQLGDFLFLDAVPDEDSLKRALDGQAYMPLYPMHFFARLTLQGGAFEISLLSEDGLRQASQTRLVSLAGQELTDGFIITATTPELQGALLRLAPRDEFWDEAAHFHRISP